MSLEPWLLWFLLGLTLILTEFAVPGVILVFLGLGAWIVAALLKLELISGMVAQLAVFGISSLGLIFSMRRLLKSWFLGDAPKLGAGSMELMDEFHGKSVLLITAFEKPGALGKVEFKGAEWTARAEEPLELGDEAEIVSVDGLTLRIRRRWIDASL